MPKCNRQLQVKMESTVHKDETMPLRSSTFMDDDTDLGEDFYAKRDDMKQNKFSVKSQVNYIKHTEEISIDKIMHYRETHASIEGNKRLFSTKKDRTEKKRQIAGGTLGDPTFDHENDMQITNRIGFSTEGWGEPSKGFVKDGKVTKVMKKKQGKYGPKELQAYFNALVVGGANFVLTSESDGAGLRKSDMSGEQLVSKFTEDFKTSKPLLDPPIVSGTMGGSPWSKVFSGNFGSAAYASSAEASAKRLGSMDHYQVKSGFLFPGKLDAVTKILAKETCAFVGAVGLGKKAVKKAIKKLEKRGQTLTSNQIEFSLTNRKALKSGLIATCNDIGVTPLAINPLDGGLASGMYTALKPGGGFSKRKLGKYQSLHQAMDAIAVKAKSRAKKRLQKSAEGSRKSKDPDANVITPHVTTKQVALNYIIAKGAVPILPVRTEEDVKDILGCIGWSLTDSEVNILDNAAAVCGL